MQDWTAPEYHYSVTWYNDAPEERVLQFADCFTKEAAAQVVTALRDAGYVSALVYQIKEDGRLGRTLQL